jgi:hypothetical protein
VGVKTKGKDHIEGRDHLKALPKEGDEGLAKL